MSTKREAYYLLLEIGEEVRELSCEREIYRETLTLHSYTREKVGHKTAAIKDIEYASITHTALDNLSKSAKLFVMEHIMPSLFMYNLLWHRAPSKKTQEKLVLKELVDNRFLFRTETIGIFVVNPLKVWRGNPITAVICTKEHLRLHRKPSIEIIHDLRPRDEYKLRSEEQYDLLARDGFTPKLLEEPQEPHNE